MVSSLKTTKAACVVTSDACQKALFLEVVTKAAIGESAAKVWKVRSAVLQIRYGERLVQ